MRGTVITDCQIKGLVCILKLLEFQEADFKPLKVVEIIVFLSFKILNFIPKKRSELSIIL